MRNIYSLLAGATGLTLTISACGEKPPGESASTAATEATTSSANAGAEAAAPEADTAAETAPVTADTTVEQPPADRPATGPVPDDPPAIKPATQADVRVGAAVSDSTGVSFGKVEAVDAQGVTISSGAIRAKLPLTSVGVGPNGLVISVTKAEFEAAAKAAGS
jgi:hypothetical protein